MQAGEHAAIVNPIQGVQMPPQTSAAFNEPIWFVSLGEAIVPAQRRARRDEAIATQNRFHSTHVSKSFGKGSRCSSGTPVKSAFGDAAMLACSDKKSHRIR
jgi:hypothetical protein